MRFHHDDHADDGQPGADATGAQPDYSAQMAQIVTYLAGQTLGERAAEVLPKVADGSSQPDSRPEMDRLLAPFMPTWYAQQPDQFYVDRDTVRHSYCEAFQALVLARLLSPDEVTDNQQGTVRMYFVTADGHAALQRGDVADVVTRRLPD